MVVYGDDLSLCFFLNFLILILFFLWPLFQEYGICNFTLLDYPLVRWKEYLYIWLFMIAFHWVRFLNINLDSQSDSSSATCDILREARQQVLYVILAAFNTLISAHKVLWTSDFSFIITILKWFHKFTFQVICKHEWILSL